MVLWLRTAAIGAMADIRFDPIADTTRRAEIVGKLRRAILCGRLRPGDKVNELRISEQMQVSRAPLREAIRELVQEGLLTNIPYAGAYVINVAAKDIEDAYALHHVLEDFAIELVWPLRDQRFAAELDRRHAQVKEATQALDTTRQIETALQLHGVIYEWADNALLLDTWQRVARRLLNQPILPRTMRPGSDAGPRDSLGRAGVHMRRPRHDVGGTSPGAKGRTARGRPELVAGSGGARASRRAPRSPGSRGSASTG